uniref:Uncharacterized protein n=1 Tax=viral metagenome TaxID=1070528 RepID=A0A6M3Y5D0_9ZZZZ
MLEIPVAVFFATILAGIVVYEYSAWRTEKKFRKMIAKYKLQDIVNLLQEIKEALT